MISECKQFQQWIPRSLAQDLSPAELEALTQHLAACSSCHAEQEAYAETVSKLQNYGEEPLPRHFFVYPPKVETKPWQLFHRLSPFWRVASAGAAACLLLLTIATASQVRIRSDHGSWTLSFGRTPAQRPVDLAALKTDIMQAVDQRNRATTAALVQDLWEEVSSTRADLTHDQQIQLVAALTGLENRLNTRIALTADDIRTGTQKSLAELYQVLSQEQEHSQATLNARLDEEANARETKTRQTDAVLDTLIQVANLNLKQTGEQK